MYVDIHKNGTVDYITKIIKLYYHIFESRNINELIKIVKTVFVKNFIDNCYYFLRYSFSK